MLNCHSRPFQSSKSMTGRAIAGNYKMSFNMRWSNARAIQSNPNIYRQLYIAMVKTGLSGIGRYRRLMSRRCCPLYKRQAVTSARLPSCSESPDPRCIASSTGSAGNHNGAARQFVTTRDMIQACCPQAPISIFAVPYVPFRCPNVPPFFNLQICTHQDRW